MAWFVLFIFTQWTVIYSVDSIIQPLNNWGLNYNKTIKQNFWFWFWILPTTNCKCAGSEELEKENASNVLFNTVKNKINVY